MWLVRFWTATSPTAQRNCPPVDGRDRRRTGSEQLAARRVSSSSDLARAVAEIQLGVSQREILRALLDTSARYASRVALFVVKGSHATGWQARGFAKNEALKDFTSTRMLRRWAAPLEIARWSSAQVADLDSRFLAELEPQPAEKPVSSLNFERQSCRPGLCRRWHR